MRLNMRQIEAFRAVYQTGGMTSAGQMMNITQPAVSRLIRDLEAEIGLALFVREGTTIAPTPDAASLYEEVERSFHGLDQVALFARDLNLLLGIFMLSSILVIVVNLIVDIIYCFLDPRIEVA